MHRMIVYLWELMNRVLVSLELVLEAVNTDQRDLILNDLKILQFKEMFKEVYYTIRRSCYKLHLITCFRCT